MGVGKRFGTAFAKALIGAGNRLPLEGTVFLSVSDKDKPGLVKLAAQLHAMNFEIVATEGTARFLNENSIPAKRIYKVNEGRPNIADEIINGEIKMVINTPLGKVSHYDESAIRRTAIRYGIPCITTLAGAEAAVEGILALKEGPLTIRAVQDYSTL
jgi:carbamoyl-phosphate synthase large subunit